MIKYLYAMEVYIEYAVVNNFVADYFLLLAAFKITKQNYKKARLAISAFLGTVIAIIMPLVFLPPAIIFILKFLSGILIVYTSKEYSSFKSFVLPFLVFVATTFALGGGLIGIFNSDSFDISSSTYGKAANLPFGIVVVGAYLIYLSAVKIGKIIYRKAQISSYLYKCELFKGSNSVKVTAFLDTGNMLTDGEGQPVVICDKAVMAALFKDGLFEGDTKAKYIPFTTVSGRSKMLVFKIDGIKIYFRNGVNIINNVTIGISPYHIKERSDYSIILHGGMCKELTNNETDGNTEKVFTKV